MDTLASALKLYREGNLAAAEAACERVLAGAIGNRRDTLTLLAELRTSAGRPLAAIENLRELALLAPQDAANLRRLGGALLAAGKEAEAADILRRAVKIEPGNVRGHNNLGQVLLQLGLVRESMRCFERTLEIDPGYAFGRLNLALGFERLGEPGLALQHYDRLLSLHPTNATGWRRRGALLCRLNRAEEALQSFDRAESLQPHDGPAFVQKATALLALERAGEALAAADRALMLGRFAPALQAKAAALCQLRRPEEASRCIEAALAAAPDDVEVWCGCALVHQQLGDHASALQCYRQATSLDASYLPARSGLLSVLIPTVPLSCAESQQARAEFDRELGTLEPLLKERALHEGEAWALARQHFFYLSYREVSNKEALTRFRQISTAHLARFAPPMHRAQVHSTSPARRFRLGIVSAHIFDHSVFDAITRGWLENLDRGRIETTLFSLGSKHDAAFDMARECVARCEARPRTLPEWARLISQLKLDAVIYPEVGMNRDSLALASLRLAPRQFAAWGHPETSGLPTIDAFLSAQAFEPAEADVHYSEQLIRLPNLGVFYRPYRIEPEPVDFAAFGLRRDGCVFVCPGTPFKYQPEDDWVLVEIAQRVAHCAFLFFMHERQELRDRLRARLSAAFAAGGLDAGRLVFMPWQPRAAFLGVLKQADVYLDTIGFSGFNTLMHSVEAQLPCVAYDGLFMRGRLGSGILRRLELDELIATDKSAYVDIAVRLGLDRDYRAGIRSKLRDAGPRAYEDRSAVVALERVLLQ